MIAVDYAGDALNGIAVLPLYVSDAAAGVISTASGALGVALSVLAIGKVEKFNKTSMGIFNATRILPDVYRGVISIFNKKVRKDSFLLDDMGKRIHAGYFRLSCERLFEKAKVLAKLRAARQPANSLKERVINILHDHIGTRVMYAAASIVTTVSRVADFILGCFAAILSVLCFGRVTYLNKLAFANLTVFGALEDLSRGIRGLVNPWQSYL